MQSQIHQTVMSADSRYSKTTNNMIYGVILKTIFYALPYYNLLEYFWLNKLILKMDVPQLINTQIFTE